MSALPRVARRQWWPLAASLVLIALFAILANHQIEAKRERLLSNQNLLEDLAKSEILEENDLTNADWPQWRGPNRDGTARVKQLPGEWVGGRQKPLWKVDGGEGYSSVVIKDQLAYTMKVVEDKEYLVSLNTVTGKEVWKQEIKRPELYMEFGYTPRSTPTIDEDRIYSVGTSGQLQCRKLADGELIWEHDLLGEYGNRLPKWGFAFSPLIVGDEVITQPGGANGNSILAFDKINGRERWRALNDVSGYSSPVLIQVDGQPQLVVMTGVKVWGLTLEGKVLWGYDWPTDFQVNASTPLFFRAKLKETIHSYVFITSGYGKGCALLRIEKNPQGGFDASRVYESNQMCCHFNSPVRAGDLILGFNEDLLTCMNIRNGDVVWSKRGYHRGSVTLLIDSNKNQRILVLGEEGKLAVYDPSSDRPLTETRVTQSKCWAPLSIAGGHIYLRDMNQLIRLELPSEKVH